MTTISKGQVWQGNIFDDVFLHILSVDVEKNIVVAETNDVPVRKAISYKLDTFEKFYKLTDNVFTRVIFKFEKGSKDVVAFLLDFPESSGLGNLLCYATIGHPSTVSLAYARECKSATVDAYRNLKEELESIGYFLRVVRKFS